MATSTRTSAEMLVNVSTDQDERYSSVTSLKDGGYVVVFTHETPGLHDGDTPFRSELYGVRYDANGVLLGQFRFDDPSVVDEVPNAYYSKVANVEATLDGGFVIVYRDEHFASFGQDTQSLYLKKYNADGGNGFFVQVDTGNGGEDFFNRYGRIDVDQSTNGNIIVSYNNNYVSELNPHVYTQLYNSLGGGGTPVAKDDTEKGFQPAVAGLAGGARALVWTDRDRDGSSNGVYLHYYDGSGSAGVDVQVNTNAVGDQSNASVTGLSDGRFVVVWQSASPNDTGYDIRAQLYTSAGVRSDGEFRVNSSLGANQYNAVVAALSDGGFAVAWVSDDQDGSGQGVYVQRYGVGGAKVGGEMLVGSSTTGDQAEPSIAARDGGGFIVTWTSSDGAGDGVFSKIFQSPTTFSGSMTTGVEIVQGDASAETFGATSTTLNVGDEIFGGGGTDRLQLTSAGRLDLTAMSAFSGVEQLYGSAGNDTFVVSTARLADVTTFVSGGGADVFAAVGSFTLKAGLNVAAIQAASPSGTQSYSYTGNAVSQSITGNAGRNIIDGQGGNDTLTGGGGNDILYGRTGNDTYFVETNGDSARESAGEGTDTVLAATTFFLFSGSEIEVLKTQNDAGTGSIDLRGNAFAQRLTGNNGANRLDGQGGADTMIGLGGNDTYSVDNAGDRVIEAANKGTDTVHATVDYVAAANVEAVVLDGTADLRATGNALANTLTGNTGRNVLKGGAGNDTYYVQTVGDVVTEGADAGTDTVHAALSFTLGANIENLILDGWGDADATGNTLANTLTGTVAVNVLDGGGGADRMLGGAGDDTYVTDGGDTIIEAADAGTDTVLSSVTLKLSANVENLTLTGTGAINGIGNTAANILRGNANINILNGGTGDDTYYVQNTGDRVSEAANAGTDTVHSTVSFSLAGTQIENLILDGSAAARATGSDGANQIVGNAGANRIEGGKGSDVLVGSGGSDTFVFHAGSGGDVIVDFTPGTGADHDVIQVDRTQYADFADLMAHASAPGGDNVPLTIISDGTDAIQLNVPRFTLVSADFLFV